MPSKIHGGERRQDVPTYGGVNDERYEADYRLMLQERVEDAAQRIRGPRGQIESFDELLGGNPLTAAPHRFADDTRDLVPLSQEQYENLREPQVSPPIQQGEENPRKSLLCCVLL